MKITLHQKYAEVPPYVTKDGSIIRELMHPSVQGNRQQSLAEASIPASTKTLLHRHQLTEELYHITQGTGLMTLGKEQFIVHQGDTVCIPPGTAHCLENTGPDMLILLCACSPAYSHADTELLASGQ
jgi:mannose-6-phosphate isomerase-like protein (cupin superfamily)